MDKLNRDFYLRDALVVAKDLLGKQLVHETQDYRIVGRIVETEAYLGPIDKASHAYGGRRTSRTEVMYNIGGTSYVYLIYGVYHCFNVVTEPKDKASAVLVRALEPVEGVEHMSKLRYGIEPSLLSPKQKLGLCNGPGKLCIALGIGKAENGLNLCGSTLYINDAKNEPLNIKTSPRINIDYAEEYKDKPWRFYIEGNKYVSKG
ncbi:MAG: DNA-3-methyladenine glycosylase [Clostridiaceae bacterium]|nr:DNA-3-methyladenine glycosylase [Clostridiaceae bacterium]